MFHQVVWCRKHKAGHRVGFYVAKGKPQQSPSQAAALHKSARPCLRDTVQLPKGLFLFFCFKYQNYKNQFINCFAKTTTKTKQSPPP